jgi:tetratricopeptide (TPR) repeat protein
VLDSGSGFVGWVGALVPAGRLVGGGGVRWCAALRLALACLLLVGAGLAAAQAQPSASELRQMQDLLDQGYYNSAARLNGPDLVSRFPDSGEAHYLYARALYLTTEWSRAATHLQRALDLVGDSDPRLVNLQGLIRAAEGDAAGALRALQNAFLRSRDYGFAMDWGRVAWQAGQYVEAIQAFDAAAQTEHGARELWPHIDKGRLLMLLGRHAEAIQAFSHALDVFEATDPGGSRPTPAYVEAYFRLGEAYESQGDLARAEVNYRAARTADPNYTPAVQALDRLSRSFD